MNNANVMIENARNGVIVYVKEYTDEGESRYIPYVFPLSDQEKYIDQTIKLIYFILEEIGISYDRHSKNNVALIHTIGEKATIDIERDADIVYQVLSDLDINIPIEGISLRCSKHPEYAGIGEMPNPGCKRCQFIKKLNHFEQLIQNSQEGEK